MERTAICSCGQLQAQTTGEPIRATVRHCNACQHRTGSVIGAQTRFPEGAVQIRGSGLNLNEWDGREVRTDGYSSARHIAVDLAKAATPQVNA